MNQCANVKMLFLLLAGLVCGAVTVATAEAGTQLTEPSVLHEPFATDVWDLYEQRYEQMNRNKRILLGWGLANVATGAALFGSDLRDFGVMNASWGLINTGIAWYAMRTTPRFSPSRHGHVDLLKHEQRFNRIVALNTGLDAGYMVAGMFMMYSGSNAQIRQYGTSVLIQGAFLFAYDLFLMIESGRYLDRITVLTAPTGAMVRLRF